MASNKLLPRLPVLLAVLSIALVSHRAATLGPLLPGLAQEIDLFQAQGERFGSRDVVAVWAGANGQVGFDALVGRSDGQEYTVNGGISFSF